MISIVIKETKISCFNVYTTNENIPIIVKKCMSNEVFKKPDKI